MNDHDCPAPGCSVPLPGYLLACARHWRQLPRPLQAAINLAWQRRRRRPDDPEAIGAHLDLVVEAMQIWVAT